MTELICDFCNKKFLNKYILQNHQNTAKYCLDIQNKNISKEFICEYCNKSFIRKDGLKDHLSSCKDKIKIENTSNIIKLTKNYEKANKIILSQKEELQKIKQQIKEYELYKILYEESKIKINKLEDDVKILSLKAVESSNKILENITTKAIENAGNKTTTNNNIVNNKNQILNNLVPLTDQYMRDQAQYFSLDYIKYGTKSLAKFATDHTFKDRIAITDASRK
jgi:hypothetical protein